MTDMTPETHATETLCQRKELTSVVLTLRKVFESMSDPSWHRDAPLNVSELPASSFPPAPNWGNGGQQRAIDDLRSDPGGTIQ